MSKSILFSFTRVVNNFLTYHKHDVTADCSDSVFGSMAMIALSHCTYRGFVFVQNLIILRHCNTENNGGYVFEAMNPLLSLRSLAADIK
jgi:hypothetical protein